MGLFGMSFTEARQDSRPSPNAASPPRSQDTKAFCLAQTSLCFLHVRPDLTWAVPSVWEVFLLGLVIYPLAPWPPVYHPQKLHCPPWFPSVLATPYSHPFQQCHGITALKVEISSLCPKFPQDENCSLTNLPLCQPLA